MAEQLMTGPEVIELFRISRSTFTRWVRIGRLNGIKLGGTYRFRRSDVEALIGEEVRHGS